MIDILFAMALAGSPVEGAAPPRPVAGASIASLFTADDYPAGAADRAEQGNVQVIVHVDDKGAVSSCEVKVSSGSPELDSQTCTIIALRAKFRPARDAKGRPVAGQVPQTISWRLEGDIMPSEPWTMRTILTFPNAGQPPACKVEVEGALAAISSAEPPKCDPSVTRLIAPDALPDPAPTLIFEKRFLRGVPAARTLAAGETLIGQTVLTIDVDSEGRVTSCKVAEQIGMGPEGNPCLAAKATRYRMGTGGKGQPAPFQASEVSTIVLQRAGPDRP